MVAVTDATSGFRAYRMAALEHIAVDTTRATGYAFQIELTARISRAGGRIVEVPIVFRDRVRGTSKMSPRIAVEALLLVTWWSLRNHVTERRLTRGDARPAPAAGRTGAREAA